MFGEQKVPMKNEQKGSGLTFESGNFPQDERGKQIRLEGRLPPHPALHIFDARCPEHLCEARGREEQEAAQENRLLSS